MYLGSIAAGIQSAYYGGVVASGSVFALAQSLAMGGATLGTVQVAALGTGVVAAGASAASAGIGTATVSEKLKEIRGLAK